LVLLTDLERRVAEHKTGIGSKFTKKYNATELLYYEMHNNIKAAIDREKQLKNGREVGK